MPIDETSTPGVAPNNDNQTTSPTGAISDLGDILMDKTVENIEKNDFVPVSKNDVAALDADSSEQENEEPFSKPSTTVQETVTPVENHATVEDLQNIMLDIPQTNASPFGDNKEQTAIQETVVEEVVEENSETTPALDSGEGTLDINLEDISLVQESTTPDTKTDILSPVSDSVSIEEPTPVIELPVENNVSLESASGDQTDMAIDLSTITTDSIQQEVSTTQEQTGTESVVTNDIGLVEESTTIIGDTQNNVVEVTQSTDSTLDNQQSIEIPQAPVPQDIPTSPSQSISTPVETFLDEPIVPENTSVITNDVSNGPDVPKTPSVDNASLEKIAADITQGIDLDSLVADGVPPAVSNQQLAADVPLTTQTPAEGIKAIAGATTAKQKKLLIILGGLVFLGVVYFAIQTFSTPSIPTPVIPQPTVNDTPSEPELTPQEEVETTGTIAEQVGLTGETTLGTGETTGLVIEEPTVVPKTRDQLLTEAKGLDGSVRKALIKATIMKNTSVRGDAFQLQKDLQTYIQTLENTNDITTLSDSEKQLETISQRLDTILTSLNGSNQ